MAAKQVFNRSPTTKNLPDWPSEASAMQTIRQRKVIAMNGMDVPGKVVSQSTGHMGGVHFPSAGRKSKKYGL